jgi:hypothetical protein
MYLKSISGFLALDLGLGIYLGLQTDVRAKLVTYAVFGFWVPTRATHAVTPWFRGIAVQSESHSKLHGIDKHFDRSIFLERSFIF